MSGQDDNSGVDAFWIDAICVPQAKGPQRLKTLESMGFIYTAASLTIATLQESTWSVIEAIGESWRPMTFKEMEIMEQDDWASRVWTYQELVNSHKTYFTAINTETQDWELTGILNRSALGVLSNMTSRKFDPTYPTNRIRVCMGSVSQDVAWGPQNASLAELADILMRSCEAKGDYSFIYTSDIRDDEPGRRWRPNPPQPQTHIFNVGQASSSKPVNLVPIVSSQMDTHLRQTAHATERGLQLDRMIRLITANTINSDTQAYIERFLYGLSDSNNGGIYHTGQWQGKTVVEVMLNFLRRIGYTGYHQPLVCETGVFYPQVRLDNKSLIELDASAGIEWRFGNPGLVRWKEDELTKYCAGVFVGTVNTELATSLLLD